MWRQVEGWEDFVDELRVLKFLKNMHDLVISGTIWPSRISLAGSVVVSTLEIDMQEILTVVLS